MKYNFENEYLTASTDSTAVAKRLIEIIEEMEKKEDPVLKTYLGDKEFKLPEQPFKGAIVVDEPEQPIVNPQTKREFAEIMAKRAKKDTPAMNITSRLHDEKYGNEIHDGGNCVETDKGCVIMKATKPAKGEKWPHEKYTSDEYPEENNPEITKPAESKPKDIEDEELEIDTVPTDDEPKPEIPHGKKLKSSDIVPQEGPLEDAYLGEHFEITPDEPEQKPLTPAEQELWDYIQKNPNYTMQGACRDLNITTANYYWRKRKLYEKGRPVGGAIPFAAKPKD